MGNESVLVSVNWVLNMMSNNADGFKTAWLLCVEF